MFPSSTRSTSASRARSSRRTCIFAVILLVGVSLAGCAAPSGKVEGRGDAPAAPASLPDGNVTTSKLADLAVTAAKLADEAVTASKLSTDAVTTVKLASLAVTAAKLAADAVTAEKIQDGAVRTAKIADLAVAASKLADAAVETAKIRDGAVTSAKLADLAVETAKLAEAAVTASKLADDAVGTMAIKDGAVTNAKLAGGITDDKLATIATPGKVSASAVSGVFSAENLPPLDASKIETGIFHLDRIPTLPAGKVSGLGGLALLGAVGATEITDGSIDLAGAKVTGTLPTARLSADVALLSGPQAFTGEKTFSGGLRFGGGGHAYGDQGGSLELGQSTAAGVTPFVDFHYGTGANQDFNVRLINDGDRRLTLDGNLRLTGGAVTFSDGTTQRSAARSTVGGVVLGDGSIFAGTGFTAQKTSTGVYKVSFAATYCPLGLPILATSVNFGDGRAGMSAMFTDTNGDCWAEVLTKNPSGTATDLGFSFVAVFT